MLRPEALAALPDAVVKLWQAVSDDILRDVARRIGKLGDVTDTAAWQLWRLEQTRAVRADVVKTLAKYSGKSDAEIRRLLQKAGTQTLAEDDALYAAAGVENLPAVNDSPALLNLLNAGYAQTAGEWRNLTATTAATVTGAFEDVCDRAWLQVSSGAFDYNTAIRRAVSGLADTMPEITYPSGHTDRLEVAVRRCVLTGVNQTAGKLQLERADEAGWEFFEVTAHAGARPSHAVWQGKVYHKGGRVTVDGVVYEDFVKATGYGTGAGLCGWNCRHSFSAFWPGVSERAWSDDELAALDEKSIAYNGKQYSAYEISQLQRGLERKVRAAKRQYLAQTAAGQDAGPEAVKLRQARQNLKAFADATRQSTADSVRTYVPGFGRSEASKATWTAKKALEPKNITLEYHKNAMPGIGLITYDKGFDKAKNSAEVEMAQWLHENLGGNIALLKASNKENQKTADYLWNGKFWDLKTVSTEKAANSAVRHGLQQIRENPGGIILNYKNRRFSTKDLEKVLDARMKWCKLESDIDIIVLSNEKIAFVRKYPGKK